MRSPVRTRRGSGVEVDENALELGVGVDRGRPHLASDAAGLETAPRSGRVGYVQHVDEDRTGAYRGGESVGRAYVPGPDRRGESVVGVVRASGEFVGVLVAQ